jgi:hypothetical protein
MLLALSQLDLTTLTFGNVLGVLGAATGFGTLFVLVYILTHNKIGYDHSFCTTLLVLPILIAIVILLVSDNIGRAVSLAGIFALVRFRTTLTDTKDVMYIFATVALGLSAGLGYIVYGIIISVFIAIVLLGVHFLKLDREKENVARLKIVIPESLNYTHAFDPVFGKYLISYQLAKVKTTDFGTTFELTYNINLRGDINQKKFLDDLRVKNGNLNISLTTGYVNKVTD